MVTVLPTCSIRSARPPCSPKCPPAGQTRSLSGSRQRAAPPEPDVPRLHLPRIAHRPGRSSHRAVGSMPASPVCRVSFQDPAHDARRAIRTHDRREQCLHRTRAARKHHVVQARLEQGPDRFAQVGRRAVAPFHETRYRLPVRQVMDICPVRFVPPPGSAGFRPAAGRRRTAERGRLSWERSSCRTESEALPRTDHGSGCTSHL